MSTSPHANRIDPEPSRHPTRAPCQTGQASGPGEDGAGATGADARAIGWRHEAVRAVNMAGVLAAGGFPEEAPPLIARAVRFAVASGLSAQGERLADPMLADPEGLRGLVKGPDVTADANRLLAALRSGTASDAFDLAASATRVIAALNGEAGT